MKMQVVRFTVISLFLFVFNVFTFALPVGQGGLDVQEDSGEVAVAAADSAFQEDIDDALLDGDEMAEPPSLHKAIKTKFIEGDAAFMSVIALALVIGLAFCIERVIYLSLSDIDARRFMRDLAGKVSENDMDGAAALCRETRGPVAAICHEGLGRTSDSMEDIERAVSSYGSLQAANLEKGCSWITMLITMAPSLGFLGTVVGIVMAFAQIQAAGDISPAIVASGMKVALITTIFGIIVALILQLFYNYILAKIDRITSQMEESAIELLDIIAKYKAGK